MAPGGLGDKPREQPSRLLYAPALLPVSVCYPSLASFLYSNNPDYFAFSTKEEITSPRVTCPVTRDAIRRRKASRATRIRASRVTLIVTPDLNFRGLPIFPISCLPVNYLYHKIGSTARPVLGLGETVGTTRRPP